MGDLPYSAFMKDDKVYLAAEPCIPPNRLDLLPRVTTLGAAQLMEAAKQFPGCLFTVQPVIMNKSWGDLMFPITVEVSDHTGISIKELPAAIEEAFNSAFESLKRRS